ncbi:MAG: uroporphyrinogen decarboxylase family protein [Opitutaceae bacterium]|nr:uroporphyrinogen decarboxylase family protein [Opitutaceae bacterium]
MPTTPHPTATRSEVESTLRFESNRSIPLFMPAIYEHKGHFIGKTPSQISRDPQLLAQAALKEYEQLGPDALAIGVDVYNLEAEAAGCEVTYYEGDDTSIPGIKPGNHVIKPGQDLTNYPVPNPLKDGRMPVNIEAARIVRKEIGDDYWIRGAISGPFSLAISLLGAEDLFISCLDDPEFVNGLMNYSAKIIKEFAKGYIDAGADLIIFDSQASPELLSPTMYEEIVLPVTQDLIAFFKTQGVNDVPLIIGGNTTPIIDTLIDTGANNLLCDFTGNWEEWSDACRGAKRALRRNIAPQLIENGTPDEIYAVAKQEIANAGDFPGFIMGTAVIPFATKTENILAIKQACIDAGS